MNNCKVQLRVQGPVAGRGLVAAALAGLLLAGLALAGCGGKKAPARGPQAMPVYVLPAQQSTVNASSSFVATLQSRQAATIMPQITGNLTRILVRSGEHVRAGQLLMVINPQQQLATVASGKSAVAAQQATTNYDLEEYQRYQALYKAQVASLEQLSQMQSTYQAAKSQLASLQAQVREQEAQLQYYHITAPRAGVIGDIPVHVGDLVTNTTMLTTLTQTGPLHVYIYVPVEQASRLRMGLPIQLVNGQEKVVASSSINFIAPQVTSGSQTVLVKGTVPDQSGALRNLQYVTAEIVWGRHPAVLVPVLDVAAINGRYFVFLAVKNPKAPRGFIAQEVPVAIGPIHQNSYEVTSGIQPGQMIITSDLQFLVSGMPVIPMPPRMPGGAAGAGRSASAAGQSGHGPARAAARPPA